MTKKQLFRAVAFLLIVVSMFVLLSDVFENGPNRTNTFKVRTYYSLEKDTLDMALIGTSGVDRYWLAPKAFEERGIASFALANNANPSWFLLPLIKDITRRHDDLKLLVVDMRPFVVNYVGEPQSRFEIRARSLTEALPFFSLARFEAINRALKITSENIESFSRFDISYLFNFIKYHTRWSEDDFNFDHETEVKTSPYMAAFIHKSLSIKQLDKPVTTVVSDERMDLDPICEKDLYELLDYFDKQDYEVLFLNTPHGQNDVETKRTNKLCDILEEKGYDYLNCKLDSELYDLKKDFYNSGHVNYYGSEKFTEWFIDYLEEHYDLPDHRGDDRYYQWAGTYDKVKKTIAAWEKEAEEKAKKA